MFSRRVATTLMQNSAFYRCATANGHRSRPLSFFKNLKKELEKSLAQNKDLQENMEKVGADLQSARERASNFTEQATNVVSKAGEATKEAAKRTAEATKESAGKAGDWAQKAGDRTGTTERIKQASDAASSAAEGAGERIGVRSLDDASSVLVNMRKKTKNLYESMKASVGQTTTTARKQFAENEYVKDTAEKVSQVSSEVEKNSAFKTAQNQYHVVRQSGILDGWGEAFDELVNNKKKKRVKVPVSQSTTKKTDGEANTNKSSEWDEDTSENEEDKEIIGDGALRVVAQEKGSWERMAEHLKEAPIIADILKGSKKLSSAARKSSAGKAARKVGDGASELKEDLLEYWETSQNPWVYRASGTIDAITAETETAMAVREVQRLDPDFDAYNFLDEVYEDVLPHIISCYLKGNNDDLRDILGEGCYARVYASIKQRKADGFHMNDAILSLNKPELLGTQLNDTEPPHFLIMASAQHINCVKNNAGDIIDGSEDEIRRVFYQLLLQREFDEKASELVWKVQEFVVHIGGVEW